jgi:hypothetical protein
MLPTFKAIVRRYHRTPTCLLLTANITPSLQWSPAFGAIKIPQGCTLAAALDEGIPDVPCP